MRTESIPASSSSTTGANFPFFLPLPPAAAAAAGLRPFLTPAPVPAPLREEAALAGVIAVVALSPLPGVVVDPVWAILRSFLRCSWTARGVQVVVSVVSWREG